MKTPVVATLFTRGRSQASRLPKAFRMPGDAVRIRRVGDSLLLKPMTKDGGRFAAVFDEIDRLGADDFLSD